MKVLPKRQNKTDDWLTPPELVRSLGAFDLDPCGSARQSGDLAETTFRLPEHNGLLEPWHGRVWCNPPFSQMKAWAQRFAVHANGVMICPARYQYAWTHVLWATADAILLLHDEVRWIAADGVSRLGSIFDFMLVAYGPANVEALRWSGLAGTLVTSRERLPLKKPLTSHPDEVESSHGHEVLSSRAGILVNPESGSQEPAGVRTKPGPAIVDSSLCPATQGER